MSEIAFKISRETVLKLVRQNLEKRKRGEDASFLDLGNCGLSEVPEEIGQLEWLEKITFSSEWGEWSGERWERRQSQNNGERNKITTLPNIFTRFKNLKTLILTNNPITELPSLAGLSELQVLDLSATQISNLAPMAGLVNLQIFICNTTPVNSLTPLAGLVHLQILSCNSTQISDLTPLAGLIHLQRLDCRNNPITDLAPLAGMISLQRLDCRNTQVADLSPLAGLTNLQQLTCNSTQVSDFTPLAGLIHLQMLSCSTTPISDLSPLAGLSQLERLSCDFTQVSDLSPLAGLTRLQRLSCDSTPVHDLSPLAGLTQLQQLSCDFTQVSDLTPAGGLDRLEILSCHAIPVSDLEPVLPLIQKGLPVLLEKVVRVDGIYVDGCPLINPPIEVVQQGRDAILNYFRETEQQGTVKGCEAKMLLVGEGGSGKTSLLRRLFQKEKELPGENESTKGIDIHRHEFKMADGATFRLNVWDFGGQEIYHATHQFFLTKRSLYVLLDDTRKDHKTVHDEGFKYWLEAIDLFSDHSPVLIFQNEKSDRSKQIDIGGIKGKFDNVKDVWAGNLEHPTAADKLGEAIEHFAKNLPHIGEELPVKWVSIRAEIEYLAETTPYIGQKEYFELYGRHLEFDRTKSLFLSQYLHDLGVFLHFQDDALLARTVILQNTWATEAVFKMLDDEVVKGKLGRFTADDANRVWSETQYADMHPELLALMQKFELCYQLPDAKPDTWLVPQLLPPSKPAKLKDWEQPGDLVLRYKYEFMPKGLVSRLMVRMHRFVPRPDMGWTTGVLFERDDSQVLVEIPSRGGEIVLRARGFERKELLLVIAADLDALNDSFHGLREKVGKWVPCRCEKCLTLTEPEFFEEKLLRKFRKDGISEWPCSKSYKMVKVSELLDGVKMEHLPGWAKEEKIDTSLIPMFIESGQTRKALEILQKVKPNAATVLSAKLTEAENSKNMGALKAEDFLRILSEIHLGILKSLNGAEA